MTRKLRWLGLAGVVALLAVAACGNEKEKSDEELPTLCDTVVCSLEGTTCDPVDGLCKCGGPGGPVCVEGTECNLEERSCVAPSCDFVKCDLGQSCDPVDGSCKCGNDVCGVGEWCVNGTCEADSLCVGSTCAPEEWCNPANGQCYCGDEDSALICSFGQSCSEDFGCVEDRCAGKNCAPGSVCNPDDGLCHCGSADGQACAIGQTCMPDGTCEGEDPCADADERCPSNTSCSPIDGLCHCGGIDPTDPVCGPGQSCLNGECLGGEQCEDNEGNPVICQNGTSCDPEDGLCKCGGYNGVDCADGEKCAFIEDTELQTYEVLCAAPCEPMGDEACGPGKGCYFDSAQEEIGTVCLPAGNNTEGGSCRKSNDCAPGFHCMKGTGDMGKCQQVCRDVSDCTAPDGAQVYCADIAKQFNLSVCFTIAAP